MLRRLTAIFALTGLFLAPIPSLADSYQDTINIFRNAGESGGFFKTAYGYAVFPTIGKGGIGIGGAYGEGRVYARGKYIGNTSMTQLSVGWQLGGEAYSQIIFFQDERALRQFTKGDFEFSAEASATAITAAAGATAATSGSSAGISGGRKDAKTVGTYYKGMATFTVATGGLMYEAAIAGQKFSYKPL